jgi:cellulose synthase/poly-beta-1,6-N-acetylglucosamine synthase-like glycosyltransferase
VTVSLVVVSKDEPTLGDTLVELAEQRSGGIDEVIVVDASRGRLDAIRVEHPWVRWLDFTPPAGARVTIPHQRNVGLREAKGDIVVFTDCGCIPSDGWIERLLAPIVDGPEAITAGPARADGPSPWAALPEDPYQGPTYVAQCATINMALRRDVAETVGGFDESFEYGSDVDFSWRAVDAGYRIRWVPDAVVRHEWGSNRRQLKRAYVYGAARVRLYRKHRDRLPRVIIDDPVPVFYPLFLLGLPLTLRYRWYPALLLVGLWRNRANPSPARSVVDHLAHAVGVLAEISGLRR